MKIKYHLRSDGTPLRCYAKTPESCHYYDESTGKEAPHFPTKDAAREYYEETQNSLQTSILPILSKKVKDKRIKPSGKGRLKKFARVSAGVTAALVALQGVSDISNTNTAAAAEVKPAAPVVESFFGDLDSLTGNEEIDEIISFGKETLDEGMGKISDWYQGSEKAQDSVARFKDAVSGWFSDFSDYDTILTVEDDGSIKWGDKSLTPTEEEVEEAKKNLSTLNVAPEYEVNYDREGMFGTQSDVVRGRIETRDLENPYFNSRGRAVSGTLKDPYTGEVIDFSKGDNRPYDLEHIVALKEIARSEDPNNPLTDAERKAIANDPSNLILVKSSENRVKGDKDAKDYLPSYKPSHCRFAIETISVKKDYELNVDAGEKAALQRVLDTRCEVE